MCKNELQAKCFQTAIARLKARKFVNDDEDSGYILAILEAGLEKVADLTDADIVYFHDTQFFNGN